MGPLPHRLVFCQEKFCKVLITTPLLRPGRGLLKLTGVVNVLLTTCQICWGSGKIGVFVRVLFGIYWVGC